MRFLAFLFLFVSLPFSIHAANRVGLVIGNDSYTDVPKLEKAVADAAAVGTALADQGFEIVTAINVPRRDMNQRISQFISLLEPGDTAFVFFAGHGVEIDGENYLLPTDIAATDIGGSDFIKSESIALSDLLDRVRSTGARTAVVIIDACRNNPFEATAGRSIGRTRGLGRITAPQGTFVIFSAGAGQLALDKLSADDDNTNSVFTRALLPHLRNPGQELRTMMSDLRVEVRDLARSVSHTQIPAYYDEMLGEYYFAGSAADATDTVDLTPIRADFELARSIGTASAFEAFLQRYEEQSDEYTVELARQMFDNLNKQVPVPASQPTQTVPKPNKSTSVNPAQIGIIRKTQQALNNLGCNAGGADGVAGPRTRRAFSKFLKNSDSALSESALGTNSGLEAVQNGTKDNCPQTVAAQSSGLSLAGTWNYTANCAVLLVVTGTMRYAHAGGNTYSGSVSDSLGQHASAHVTLNGFQISGTHKFGVVTDNFTARLAPDGQSFSGAGSTGCTFLARKG
jgi:peptidoglycan hydrolase-like protein with peptidoglycan-binding domain